MLCGARACWSPSRVRRPGARGWRLPWGGDAVWRGAAHLSDGRALDSTVVSAGRWPGRRGEEEEESSRQRAWRASACPPLPAPALYAAHMRTGPGWAGHVGSNSPTPERTRARTRAHTLHKGALDHRDTPRPGPWSHGRAPSCAGGVADCGVSPRTFDKLIQLEAELHPERGHGWSAGGLQLTGAPRFGGCLRLALLSVPSFSWPLCPCARRVPGFKAFVVVLVPNKPQRRWMVR